MTKKIGRIILIVVMIMLVIGLSLVTMSASPLYRTNQWVDTNAMFSMGRALASGMVPYRDIVEQRGPLMFGLFAIASFISKTSFIGVFVIEVINALIVYFFASKIAAFYFDNKNVASVLGLLGPGVMVGTHAFELGGAPEEFAFPVIMGFIYLAFLWQRHNKQLRPWLYLIAGFGLFYVFWVKYAMIGALIIFFLYVGFGLLADRNWRGLFMAVGLSLIGFLVPSAVMLGVFYQHHALQSLIDVYFKMNMMAYGENQNGIISQLVNSLGLFAEPINQHWLITAITAVGLVLTKIGRQRSMLFMMFFGTVAMLVLTHFVREYYVLLLMPFFVVALFQLFAWLINWQKELLRPVMLLVMIGIFVIPFYGNSYIKTATPRDAHQPFLARHGQPTDQSVQERFAADMHKKSKHPSILMVNSLDSGFFLAANTHPVTRYFHLMNMTYDEFPEMYNSFSDTMTHRRVQYVVVFVPGNQPLAIDMRNALNGVHPYNKAPLVKNYRLIDTGYQLLAGKPKNWALFELK